MNYIITQDGMKLNDLSPELLFNHLLKNKGLPTPAMLKTFKKMVDTKNIYFLDSWFLKYREEWEEKSQIKFETENLHSMPALAKGFEHVLAVAEISFIAALPMCTFLPIHMKEIESLERKMFIDNFLNE